MKDFRPYPKRIPNLIRKFIPGQDDHIESAIGIRLPREGDYIIKSGRHGQQVVFSAEYVEDEYDLTCPIHLK